MRVQARRSLPTCNMKESPCLHRALASLGRVRRALSLLLLARAKIVVRRRACENVYFMDMISTQEGESSTTGNRYTDSQPAMTRNCKRSKQHANTIPNEANAGPDLRPRRWHCTSTTKITVPMIIHRKACITVPCKFCSSMVIASLK